jgi:hypothetical protein
MNVSMQMSVLSIHCIAVKLPLVLTQMFPHLSLTVLRLRSQACSSCLAWRFHN